jgi:hypothetical protein
MIYFLNIIFEGIDIHYPIGIASILACVFFNITDRRSYIYQATNVICKKKYRLQSDCSYSTSHKCSKKCHISNIFNIL